MRRRNILGHIRQWFDAAVHILVKKIAAQLRIKNLASKHRQSQDQQIGTTAINKYATIRRFRKLQSSRDRHHPIKRNNR